MHSMSPIHQAYVQILTLSHPPVPPTSSVWARTNSSHPGIDWKQQVSPHPFLGSTWIHEQAPLAYLQDIHRTSRSPV